MEASGHDALAKLLPMVVGKRLTARQRKSMRKRFAKIVARHPDTVVATEAAKWVERLR